MTRTACLAIGVSDAPPLDYLPGAVNGARGIARWASALGYRTALLTDEVKPVDFETIVDALIGKGAPTSEGINTVRAPLLSKSAKTDRLLIYFAGHGLARDGQEDLWLLSEWFQQQRAVAVSGFRRKLQRFSIDQVSIIADACRSLAVDVDSADLTPDSILGRGPFDAKMPASDILQASSKYRAAYMVPGDTADDDRCIFTGVLEEALWGLQPSAFAVGRPTRCITSGSLAKYLWSEVPARAQSYKVELNPEIQPGFLDPDDVYLRDPVPASPVLRPWPAPTPVGAMGPTPIRAGSGARGWSTQSAGGAFEKADGVMNAVVPNRDLVSIDRRDSDDPVDTIAVDRARIAQAQKKTERRLRRFEQQFAAEVRPTHFESGAGFTVVGASVLRAALGPGAVAEDAVGEAPGGVPGWRVAPLQPDGAPTQPGTQVTRPYPLLVELTDGRWAGAAAMPGFVATFSVSDVGVESVIYRGMGQQAAPKTEAAVAALRAGSLGGLAALDYALGLRTEKHADPMLGVIAAYLYDAQGDIESIRQIAYYHVIANQPVPFDVAMLAGLSSRCDGDGLVVVDIPAVKAREPRSGTEARYAWAYQQTGPAVGTVAGSFPWLRQGWQLLEDEDRTALINPDLATLRDHLAPTAFVTLDAEGGRRLQTILFG